MPVSTSTGTYLSNLFDPEVVGDMIQEKLIPLIKLAPLAVIDTTLSGRPGDTVTLPSFAYIGDATDVAEGADIPIAQLVSSTTTVTVKKAGKGVQLTDEAVLSGYGDPRGEAIKQLALAIASKADTDLMTALNANTLVSAVTGAFSAKAVSDALVKFGEDIDGPKVILVDGEAYAILRDTAGWIPNTEIGADMIIRGAVGMVHGCQVVVSNRVTANTYHIVKPGALALFMKRDTLVETDRDIVSKSTVLTADKHYAAYLYDTSKAIKITVTPA